MYFAVKAPSVQKLPHFVMASVGLNLAALIIEKRPILETRLLEQPSLLIPL